MNEILSAFLGRLKKVANYDPEADMPDGLVTRSAQAHWIGEEITHNPGRIGAMLDIPAKSIELFLQEIPVGGTSDMQRHTHESIHYVIEGEGHSEIGDRTVQWSTGDFVYTPVWVWHRHYATGITPVRMLLVENSRLIEPLGLARRETAGLVTRAEMDSRNTAVGAP